MRVNFSQTKGETSHQVFLGDFNSKTRFHSRTNSFRQRVGFKFRFSHENCSTDSKIATICHNDSDLLPGLQPSYTTGTKLHCEKLLHPARKMRRCNSAANVPSQSLVPSAIWGTQICKPNPNAPRSKWKELCHEWKKSYSERDVKTLHHSCILHAETTLSCNDWIDVLCRPLNPAEKHSCTTIHWKSTAEHSWQKPAICDWAQRLRVQRAKTRIYQIRPMEGKAFGQRKILFWVP